MPPTRQPSIAEQQTAVARQWSDLCRACNMPMPEEDRPSMLAAKGDWSVYDALQKSTAESAVQFFWSRFGGGKARTGGQS